MSSYWISYIVFCVLCSIAIYIGCWGIKEEFICYIFLIFYFVVYSFIHFFYVSYLAKYNVSIDPTEGDLSSIYRERIDYSLDSSKSEDFKEKTDKNNEN